MWSAVGWCIVMAGMAAYQGHVLFQTVKRWHPDYRLSAHVAFFVVLLLPLVALVRRTPLETKATTAVLLTLVYAALVIALEQALMFMRP